MSQGADHPDDTDDAMSDHRYFSIHRSLSSLLFSDKFSDMTIRCGGRDFKAHRAIVCPQSPFFDKAATINFKETASQTIDLPDDDPDVLGRFLEFLYTGNYTDNIGTTLEEPSQAAMITSEDVDERLQHQPGTSVMHLTTSANPGSSNVEADMEEDEDYQQGPESPEPDEEYLEFGKTDIDTKIVDVDISQPLVDTQNNLQIPLRVYIMADKFDVPALRLLARDRFYRTAELVWQEAECFPEVIDELYRNTAPTDTMMREIVCRLVGSRITDDGVREKMRHVMSVHGEFAVGVMDYTLSGSHMKNSWI